MKQLFKMVRECWKLLEAKIFSLFQTLVSNLADVGVYTILDAHQVNFSSGLKSWSILALNQINSSLTNRDILIQCRMYFGNMERRTTKEDIGEFRLGSKKSWKVRSMSFLGRFGWLTMTMTAQFLIKIIPSSPSLKRFQNKYLFVEFDSLLLQSDIVSPFG